MAENPRIEELRRRVKADPASLAFAQLAEEYRRAGRLAEAVETCHAGLAAHPNYLSARVTLGRALLELGELDAAQAELAAVISVAPENLAAIRGLAEIHQRRGELREALDYFRSALEFAQEDPDLAQIVSNLHAHLGAADRPPEQPVEQPAATASALTRRPPARAEAQPQADMAEVVRQQIAVLERWLDAILAAREQATADT